MSFIGLDVGGRNTLLCVRDESDGQVLLPSQFPERPSVVLLPLIRQEKPIAGDAALLHDRGSGEAWPPLARVEQTGWSNEEWPENKGRLLVAELWHRLCKDANWSATRAAWHPPDSLPHVQKPPIAELLNAEVDAALARTPATPADRLVLTVPNSLPEIGQEALLRCLPPQSRLLWRPVAAAMAWADGLAVPGAMRLAVVDVGFQGAEIAIFQFKRVEKDGCIFHVPVRKPNSGPSLECGCLLADQQTTLHRLFLNDTALATLVSRVKQQTERSNEIVVCGPLAERFCQAWHMQSPAIPPPPCHPDLVARGAALFAWRLARGWPTYIDVLPSLELFVHDKHGEPHWLKLIAESHELAGGEEFVRVFDGACSVQKGTESLDNWLQRSGEHYFRHLTTKLPRVPEHDVSLNLEVGARSAGGFARICMTSARGQAVFGASQSVMLDWQSMKTEKRIPAYPWPPDLVKHAWPDGGELLANRDFFREFLFFEDRLEQTSRSRDPQQWSNLLPMLKEQVKRTISPFALGGVADSDAAAPVNFLLCFGSSCPCRFWSNQGIITEQEIRRVAAMGSQLWERLQKDERNWHRNVPDRKSLIYILGRFGGHAPGPFQDWLAGQIVPTSKDPILFAAGRALATPDHGRKVFDCLKTKADFGQELKNNWLRMLVYLLYQRESFLEEAPREHVLAAMRLALNAFVTQVDATIQRPMLFKNSLRTLALLLRIRRNRDCRDFLTGRAPTSEERAMTAELDGTLERALRLRLNAANRDLVKRTRDWLREGSDTGVFPPIVTDEDVLTNDDEGGDEGINDA